MPLCTSYNFKRLNVKVRKQLKKVESFVFYIVLVSIAWLLYAILIPRVYSEMTERGQFGDSFGALNTLFSGFAFAGIIFTIILQKRELALQRRELEYTRKELE